MHTKPKFIPSRLRAISAATFALFLTACSGSSIEGKYRDEQGTVMEFIKGGTLIISVAARGKQFTGSWERIGNDRIKLAPGSGAEFNGSSQPQICDYHLDNKSIYLSGCPLAPHELFTRL